MRIFGRITVTNPDGSIIYNPSGGPYKKWVTISTDANGSNDLLYATALCQCLLLNLNESPFWSSAGIPQTQSVIQQVYPDYYVGVTQQLYSPFFAALQVSRNPGKPPAPPTYNITALLHSGTVFNASIPLPI